MASFIPSMTLQPPRQKPPQTTPLRRPTHPQLRPTRRPSPEHLITRVESAIHADHLGLALTLLSEHPTLSLPPLLAEELALKLRLRRIPSPTHLNPHLTSPDIALTLLSNRPPSQHPPPHPAAKLTTLVRDRVRSGRLADAFAAVDNAPPDTVCLTTLEALVEAACSAGQLRKAGYTLQRLFPRFGIHPSARAFCHFVDACGRVGNLQRAVETLSAPQFRQLDVVEQTPVFERVVYACVNCRALDRAEGIVLRMKSACVPRTEQLYANLLRGSARTRPVDRSLGILRLMQMDGFSPNVGAYNALIFGCSREGRLRDALAFYDTIRKSSCMSPNLDTFNALLACCAKASSPDTAFAIMAKMRTEARITPNAKSYNWVVVACARVGDVHRAFQVAETMRREGIRLNIITNNNLLEACCLAGRLERAFVHVKQMIQVHELAPNSHTYNILIRGIGKWGQFDAALRMLKSMRSAGVSPTVITYSIAVDACARAGGAVALDSAFDLVDEMRQSGLEPNLVTYNSLIHACAKAQNVDAAFQVLWQMKEDKIVPDLVTLCSLVDACGRAGQTEKAFDVVANFLTDFPTLKPSEPVYNALIHACFKAGDLDMMNVALQRLKQVGLNPNMRTYSTLISGHAALGDMKTALSVLEEMKNVGLTPNRMIYTSLVSGYGHKGLVASAMEVLEEAKRACGEPDEELYTAAVVSAIGGGRKELALQLSREMSRAGYSAPTLLNRMMRKVGDVERTAEELKDILCAMQALNIRPQRAAVESLIATYAKEADVEGAFSILPLMDQLGYPPNLATYKKVIQACVPSGRKDDVKRAHALFQQLRNRVSGNHVACSRHWFELYEAILRAVAKLPPQVQEENPAAALLKSMAKDCGLNKAKEMAKRLNLTFPHDALEFQAAF